MTLREYRQHRIDRHTRLAERARARYQIKLAQGHEAGIVRFQGFLAELEAKQ